jgi:peptide/nickel transport system ATP-binding protein
VGESGCGKSTTARAIMQLPPPTSGSVRIGGVELTQLGRRELRKVRTKMQMVFQDPISSLNPRRKVFDLVGEGPAIWQGRKVAAGRIDEMLDAVGLDPALFADRWAHQLSGGQCQRVCIARALALDPEVVICDEPVSALDVSVQAQILNLLSDMKDRYGLTMVFIAHDLAVVKNISDRIIVMYLGKVCEVAAADELYETPRHPYTHLLLESIPVPDPDQPIELDAYLAATTEQPSPVEPPSGCRFRTRCPRAQSRCAEVEPMIQEIDPGHFVACHFPVVPTPSVVA